MLHSPVALLGRADSEANAQRLQRQPALAPVAVASRHEASLDDDVDTLRIDAAEKQRLVAIAFAPDAEPAPRGRTTSAFPAPAALGQPRWLEIRAAAPPPPVSGRRLAVAPHAIIRHVGRAAVPASFPRRTASLVMPDVIATPSSFSCPVVDVPPSGVRRRLSLPIASAARAFRGVRRTLERCLLACARRLGYGDLAQPQSVPREIPGGRRPR